MSTIGPRQVDEGDTFYGPVNLAVCVIGAIKGSARCLSSLCFSAMPLGTGRRRDGYASKNRRDIAQRPQRRLYRPVLVRRRCAGLLSGDPIASFLDFEVRAVGQPFEAPATFLNNSP